MEIKRHHYQMAGLREKVSLPTTLRNLTSYPLGRESKSAHQLR